MIENRQGIKCKIYDKMKPLNNLHDDIDISTKISDILLNFIYIFKTFYYHHSSFCLKSLCTLLLLIIIFVIRMYYYNSY